MHTHLLPWLRACLQRHENTPSHISFHLAALESGGCLICCRLDFALDQLDEYVLAAGEGASVADVFEGLIFVGGCAMNVKLNQLMQAKYPFRVFVPSAPNDSGLTIGAAWSVLPPSLLSRNSVARLGMPLWDIADLPALIVKRNAKRVSIEDIAELLLRNNVLAVVRGRQEVGPRALGHRSLIGLPDSAEMKDTMNRLKVRQDWRPVAPIVKYERRILDSLFNYTAMGGGEGANERYANDEDKYSSPYISFAPKLFSAVQAALPAISHIDGTARLQTLSAQDDRWLHELLCLLEKAGKYPVLMNTSFNSRGAPIVNTLASSLHMLDTLDGLDYLVVEEEWLFQKGTAATDSTARYERSASDTRGRMVHAWIADRAAFATLDSN